MTFLQVLATTILGFILREAPNVQRNEELKQKFEQDIAATLEMEEMIADGRLVDAQTDTLLLAAVTYRESRFRLPPADGDCRYTHRLANTPAGLWPAGYKPVMNKVCNAIGPQQLGRGNAIHFPFWAEVQTMFPERDWSTSDGRKKDRLTEAQMRDPEMNIKLSYAVLVHWKNECKGKHESAPAGVWFTAYRYGRCPFYSKMGKYHIDYEAKTRCELVASMAAGFKNGEYALPQDFRCTYDSAEPTERKQRSTATGRLSSRG